MENKRILYGDDNEQKKESLARELRLRRLEVDLASTPAETISKARAGNYFAVVTDLNYTEEGTEGYEVLKQLKDLPAKKILYTGQAGFEYVADGFMHGADYVVLSKHEKSLLEVLDKLLKGGEKDGK